MDDNESELDSVEYEHDEVDEESPDGLVKRIRGSTQVPKRGKSCPLCQGKFTHLRRHTLRTHLPWYVSPGTACWRCKLQFGQTRFKTIHIKELHPFDKENCEFDDEQHGKLCVELMNGYLQSLTEALHLQKIHHICDYVNNTAQYKQTCEFSIFLEEDAPFLGTFEQINHLDNTLHLRPYPAVSITSLLHWRILSLLSKDSGYPDITTERKFNIYNPPVVTYFIDSHFHLDKLQKRVGSSDFHQFPSNTSESITIDSLQYGISNFCFPMSWPTSQEREKIREDERIRLTLGIHPRIIGKEKQRVIDIWLQDLNHILSAKKVVAVGECGLDTTDRLSSREFEKQVKTFKNQVKIAKERNLPIVIHCRGNYDISNKCLGILTDRLTEEHQIHRHCFNGSYAEYIKWKIAFPYCKFGVSPCLLNEHKYPHLRELVCKMELTDILLESDAPYLPGENGVIGTPTLVRDIARKIANLHNITTEEVAKITSRNATRLYNIS